MLCTAGLEDARPSFRTPSACRPGLHLHHLLITAPHKQQRAQNHSRALPLAHSSVSTHALASHQLKSSSSTGPTHPSHEWLARWPAQVLAWPLPSPPPSPPPLLHIPLARTHQAPAPHLTTREAKKWRGLPPKLSTTPLCPPNGMQQGVVCASACATAQGASHSFRGAASLGVNPPNFTTQQKCTVHRAHAHGAEGKTPAPCAHASE